MGNKNSVKSRSNLHHTEGAMTSESVDTAVSSSSPTQSQPAVANAPCSSGGRCGAGPSQFSITFNPSVCYICVNYHFSAVFVLASNTVKQCTWLDYCIVQIKQSTVQS